MMTTAPPETGRRARVVLLVEDNGGDAELVKEYLAATASGPSRIVHVSTLADATAYLEAHAVDVVLLDLRLPDAWGVECVTTIRHAGGQVPIVVLTGLEDDALSVACLEAGAQDYISKHALQGRELDRAMAYAIVRSQVAHLLDATPDAMVVVSARGVVRYANQAARALFSGGPESLVGSTFTHPMRLGEPVEITVSQAGGERVCEMRVASFEWQGEPAFLGAIRDLTELRAAERALRRTEEQLLHAQKMDAVGRLAGGVAHDFNNLLMVIMGYANMLLDEFGEQEPGREMLQGISEAAERASTLTRQLLVFSRKQVLEPQSVDVNLLVTNLERMLRRVIGAHVAFRLELAEEVGGVYVDPGQLEHVLVNMAVNARDAMPDGGVLTIGTSQVDLDEAFVQREPGLEPGPYVCIHVADTGVGMDTETQQQMFDPFFTTKDPDAGTGLGLSTAYGVVSQSGGHISVYSEPGHGTTMRIYLPVRDAPAPASSRAQPPTRHPRGTETVLLVEDDAEIRRLVERTLSSAGYDVLTARDGQEALSLMLEHDVPADVVLTDVVMPHVTGPELVARLAEAGHEVRALYMSGYAGVRGKGMPELPAGAEHLQKPFTPTVLLERLRKVLDA